MTSLVITLLLAAITVPFATRLFPRKSRRSINIRGPLPPKAKIEGMIAAHEEGLEEWRAIKAAKEAEDDQ